MQPQVELSNEYKALTCPSRIFQLSFRQEDEQKQNMNVKWANADGGDAYMHAEPTITAPNTMGQCATLGSTATGITVGSNNKRTEHNETPSDSSKTLRTKSSQRHDHNQPTASNSCDELQVSAHKNLQHTRSSLANVVEGADCWQFGKSNSLEISKQMREFASHGSLAVKHS
ncbi:unnamed protein product [Ceratitis capitata]|uniref:(Mediterranean fruit fly) hypothetical protein n=1 Tax=Ceratitis capitata TaxID=7213 RepID=A0A811U5D1_CERCA|nr:unnamed protein product [Ceratitis capitata]